LVWLALFTVAAGLLFRIAAMCYWGTGTIESEGAEYAKIAENLHNGVGYMGLVFPGPQMHFPPLFPWLIAGASFFTGNHETAGRLVSLIFGALLPLPVFGIAARLFKRRVGFIAAGLVLLHPLSIHLSFMVYSEGPYATLLLFAVYLVIRALEHPSIQWWLAMGAAFGICYLVRAESLAVFAISLFFSLVATEGAGAMRVKRAARGIAVFLLVASPQIIFLYK
jgi:4-amino-4-deoxy-L-arabinose transferase-like glycosyltransferase